ncbi:MAG: ribonuclease III family protein [Clostridia bacterium]|nr:ribonuclease III family protein [Clostridia bacterium]
MITEKAKFMRARKAIKIALREKTGIVFKDYLIEQAFTRSSFSKRYGGSSNEILEHIGDTVLGYHIERKLCEHYGVIHRDENECVYTFRAHERDFATLKSTIVSNHTLATIMDEWDLCKYLLVGQSDIDNEIDKQEKIKADLLEAIIGAIAIQHNWNQKRLDDIIAKILPIEQFILEYEKGRPRPQQFSASNAVTMLKQVAEHESCSIPEYEIIGPDKLGYTQNGDPRWCCECRVQSHGISLCVFTHSKKEAKKYAAYLALCEMFDLTNEYGPCRKWMHWGWDGKCLTPNPPHDF